MGPTGHGTGGGEDGGITGQPSSLSGGGHWGDGQRGPPGETLSCPGINGWRFIGQ